jgi:glyoxylase-like metal-dependent hydrolase (beta-lactamase superfamily II)
MIRRAALLLTLFAAATASAQRDPPAWTRPIPPVPLIGPITYVGTEGLAAYLIRTRAGAILIDGTLEENVPAIERNVAANGVSLRSVKLLLNSHAHFDHAAGLARLKRDTGASVAAGVGDAAALREGVPPGETSYGVIRFPAVPVDRAVRDGERLRLGEVTLTAIATPGHTPGNTSWLMQVGQGRRRLNVLFLGSLRVAGNKLIGNGRYPGIVADFRRSFDRLGQVRADVILPMHPESADVLGRARAGTLIAPGLLPKLVTEARTAFEAELVRQQRAAATSR